MRRAAVYCHGVLAGYLEEKEYRTAYSFRYVPEYVGCPISLTMPVSEMPYAFDSFPPFFDGLLPEGPQLEALLRYAKIDRGDLFSQMVFVGADLVGAVTVKEIRGEAA